METFLIKALQLILSLSILVVVHEFGHFIFAKIFKIRVEKFYLFFDPWFSLFKIKPKNSDTEYGIGWLPLGGYVKISGMMDESFDEEQLKQPPQPWEFRTKPAWQRLLVMGGGVLFNFILAFFIYSMMTFFWGNTYIDASKLDMGMTFSQTVKDAGFVDGDIIQTVDGKTFVLSAGIRNMNNMMAFLEAKEVVVIRNGETVKILLPEDFRDAIKNKDEGPIFQIITSNKLSFVQNGSAAQKAGLQPKDIIISINDVPVTSFEVLNTELKNYANQTFDLTYLRGVDTCKVAVSLGEQAILGVSSSLNNAVVQQKFSFLESFPEGAQMAKETLLGYMWQMKFVFSKDGLSNLGGFGTLGSLFPASWDWATFWMLTAFLSIAIGFFNILPIPMLDGGHIMFLLYEVITRRKPSDNFMKNVQIAGMVFLLLLLVIANGNDLIRSIFG